MQFRIVLKILSLVFCIIGAIFLNLGSITWFHDVLSISLCGYCLIILITLVVFALNRGNIDEVMDTTFMIVGATLNFTGGVVAIIYYADPYERFNYEVSKTYLLIIGLAAILAGTSMTLDVLYTKNLLCIERNK